MHVYEQRGKQAIHWNLVEMQTKASILEVAQKWTILGILKETLKTYNFDIDMATRLEHN